MTIAAPPVTARSQLAEHVTRTVEQLLAQRATSRTTAVLARLRRAVSAEPGADPTLWDVTIGGLEPEHAADDATPRERAAHLALCLFALHQQSRPEPMHRRGRGLGQAVRELDRSVGGGGDSGPSPVRRRFDALATATSLDETSHHLRGIVGQLRAHSIPVDYGQLADDLLALQSGRGAHVRLRWARQLCRTTVPATSSSPDSDEAVSDASPTTTTKEQS